MGVGTNGRWGWANVERPIRIAQASKCTRQPNPGVIGGGKRLNAETGNQRVKRRDGSGTSRISEADWMRIFKDRSAESIERYSRDHRPNFVSGTALRRL
jgi:hypothetical protein